MSQNPTYIFGSPGLLELIKRNVCDNDDLSSIHTFVSGGDFLAPLQNKAGVEFFKKHNATTVICNGSGNAETTGTSTMAVGSIIKSDTVGKVLVGTKAIIVNPDTMEELKYGEEGMLCIAGGHVFDRYYIRSDLNKVYLEHIQNIMSLIDVIDSCCVVQKPDKDLLFTNKAYVVLKDGVLPTKEISDYIINMCYRPLYNSVTNETMQLKLFEVPESITFLDKLPLTEADKVDYKLLEKMALEECEEYKVKRRENS